MDARGFSGRDDPNETVDAAGDDARTEEEWSGGSASEGDDGVQTEDWWEPDDRPPWWRNLSFYSGALAGMLVIAFIWLLVSAVSGSGADQTSNAAGRLSSDRTTGPSPADRRERDCAQTAAGLQQALHAVGPALDQWEVHVGAMNKLVVGAITQQQANQFWNQTRVGARRHLAAFRAAERDLAHEKRSCPAPADLRHAPAKLRACARIVAHDRATLAVAREAIDTWSRHVREMDMLRMGHLSPSRAGAMWLASWKRGQRQLDDYRAAADAQHRQSCTS